MSGVCLQFNYNPFSECFAPFKGHFENLFEFSPTNKIIK